MILEKRITNSLRVIENELQQKGELLAPERLAQYYGGFRARFGPDVLRNLDGEALLEALHAHGTRESLVYWLEFKNDDELPARFGSISGGSALKFGIYRNKESGVWLTGTPNKTKQLTLDEAIGFARRHRDQLVQGCEILDHLPVNGSDTDYRRLQEQLDASAPDVSDLSWGHKYFSLLYPDKLDDYHNPDYQRFFLIKLLLQPPEGKGRYLVAGRFMAIGRELEMAINNLTKILNTLYGRPNGYWRIGTTAGDTGQSRWEPMRDGGFVAIGWHKLGDLSGLSTNQESKEAIRENLATHYPNNPQTIGRETRQIFQFLTMPEGDVVVASRGEKVLGIGRVTDGYEHDPSSDFPHRRSVEWLSLAEWKPLQQEGLQTSVYPMKDFRNLLEIERRMLDGTSSTFSLPVPTVVQPHPKAAAPVGVIPRLGGTEGRIQAVLERKKQVILYGPPGTGKTYWAQRAARDLAAYSWYGVAFGQLDDAQRAVVLGEDGAGGAVRMCSFHPAYGYEDFMEGYRPELTDGSMAFQVRDGIFKRLCLDSTARPERRYFLIIDEINRGDISRIFGELLTILERDKRGQPVLLPLSGQAFRVPSNVYLVGTMNTADRSIALLDKALRRRFGFIELMPDSGLLRATAVAGVPLGPWLDALNRRICEYIGRDARNLQIGHSYLLDGGAPVADFPRFARVLQEDIIPLLEEYCYEDYALLEKLLGKSLVHVAEQRIRHELFEPARQEELIQALLAPAPEVTTSYQALASEAESQVEAEEEAEEAVGAVQ